MCLELASRKVQDQPIDGEKYRDYSVSIRATEALVAGVIEGR